MEKQTGQKLKYRQIESPGEEALLNAHNFVIQNQRLGPNTPGITTNLDVVMKAGATR